MSSPVAPSSVVFGGAFDLLHFCPSAILASHQPQQPCLGAGLAGRLAKHDDATRSSRHVCHAPTLSAAKKRRLGSGASAAVVLQAEGPEACPVTLCIHAERHGMRSFLFPKSLVRDSEPRSTRLVHPAGLLIHSNTSSTAPSPSSCDHVLSFDRSHSPASLPQLPSSVKTPSLGETDPSAVRPTYPNAPLLAADWYLTAVAPDWHDTNEGFLQVLGPRLEAV